MTSTFNMEAVMRIPCIYRPKPGDRSIPMTATGGFGLLWRLRCAWLAFAGKCDLVKWPEWQ